MIKPNNGHWFLTKPTTTTEVHFNVRGSRVQVLRLRNGATLSNWSITRTQARLIYRQHLDMGFVPGR